AGDREGCRGVEPDGAKLRRLWREMEFTRLVKELPPPAAAAAPEPSRRLNGKVAITEWLNPVPAGAPLALDWAGESLPPEPRVAELALFHPTAGAVTIEPGEAPGSLG